MAYCPEKPPSGVFANPYLQGWMTKLVQYFNSRTGIRSVTAATTFQDTDWLIRADVTAGGFSVTLPLAANLIGRVCIVKKIDAGGNTLTLARSGSDTIDGATTKTTATQYAIIRVVSNGTTWDVI